MPVKLCYLGNTFINSSDYQGRLKESTQCGAELIGDGSISADAEILSMTVESMLESGLKNFQISVGHSQFFYGLTKAAGLSGEQEEDLRELIANKNFFGVEEFVDSLSMNDKLRKLFGLLDNFDLQDEQLMEALKLAEGYDEILSSIDTLLKLREYLKAYGIEKYISYELGLISDYTYYTGIIFQGYTDGTGEPIVKGGRYDKLLSHFGKDAAAIGFAIDRVHELLYLMRPPMPFSPVGVPARTLAAWAPRLAPESMPLCAHGARATGQGGAGCSASLLWRWACGLESAPPRLRGLPTTQ